ncbi:MULTISPECIES: molybdate ABC transporter permease subunit [Corallincola]|uniref:Molybdenum transport system permease n=3 Tax=Corallincola TaxID=1775176 RepID=A0A368NPT9_9GAMM|nr:MULTISPECIES: molybdate ABC transporter permease subunit [Corallincola]RCU51694.1 molybdate ABC transporter permease subunit [Corallincola holothuriorum]TAA47193.1 molybdate ABC transporter permease subunit [Corallincola spongiicola]TCI04853.1 molybdate ABC transporter permease subunit [Corallincola luteus]
MDFGFSAQDIAALWLTVKLSAVTTLLLLVLCPPLAWWLAHTRRWHRPLIEAIVALPLILPPTVLGFYLLVAFAPQGPVGSYWQALFGTPLAFSFSALVIGSMLYSLPFIVQPLQAAYQAIDQRQLEVARTLGMSPLRRFFKIILPQTKRATGAAGVLGFSHTVGEFGVVLMIGGNIPGATQVLSIVLFDHVEALDYAAAHRLAGGLLLFSLLALSLTYSWLRAGNKAPR